MRTKKIKSLKSWLPCGCGARLHDQSFRQKLGQSYLTTNLLKENFVKTYHVYTIKVFIPSYLYTVNLKTNKMAELDHDFEKIC